MQGKTLVLTDDEWRFLHSRLWTDFQWSYDRLASVSKDGIVEYQQLFSKRLDLISGLIDKLEGKVV